MTYNVLKGTLNRTHSLTLPSLHLPTQFNGSCAIVAIKLLDPKQKWVLFINPPLDWLVWWQTVRRSAVGYSTSISLLQQRHHGRPQLAVLRDRLLPLLRLYHAHRDVRRHARSNHRQLHGQWQWQLTIRGFIWEWLGYYRKQITRRHSSSSNATNIRSAATNFF